MPFLPWLHSPLKYHYFQVGFALQFIYYSLWTMSHLITNLLSYQEHLWPVSLTRARCEVLTVLEPLKHTLFIHLWGLQNSGPRPIPVHTTMNRHVCNVWAPSHLWTSWQTSEVQKWDNRTWDSLWCDRGGSAQLPLLSVLASRPAHRKYEGQRSKFLGKARIKTL